MSSLPVDSLFGVPYPSYGDRPEVAMSDSAEHGDADAPESDESASEVEWVNSELLTISSTIEELQGRLEQANARLATAARVETTEFEIGRLFVEAQRFSEASLSRLEAQIHEVLAAAEAKAKQILTEATEEALEIRRQAQLAAFASTRTVQELQSAIVGFTTVNHELIKELGALNAILTPGAELGTTELDPSSSETEGD